MATEGTDAPGDEISVIMVAASERRMTSARRLPGLRG